MTLYRLFLEALCHRKLPNSKPTLAMWKPIHFPPTFQGLFRTRLALGEEKKNQIQWRSNKKPQSYIWVFPKIGVFPPKWMVKIMETLIKMDDLGGKPHFRKHPFFSKEMMPFLWDLWWLHWGVLVRSFGGPAVWICRKSHHLAQKRSLTERC